MTIRELRKLNKAATPRPWKRDRSHYADWGWIRGGDDRMVADTARPGRYSVADCGKPKPPAPIDENADLIVAAVNALPRLLAEIELYRHQIPCASDRCEECNRLSKQLADAGGPLP